MLSIPVHNRAPAEQIEDSVLRMQGVMPGTLLFLVIVAFDFIFDAGSKALLLRDLSKHAVV